MQVGAAAANALTSCMCGRVRQPKRRQIGLICTQLSGEITHGAAEQNGGTARPAVDQD